MRTYSSEFVSTISGISPEELPLIALEIAHAALPEPVRVVNDSQDLISGGHTFIAAPFRFVLPDDQESQAPRASLAISNIGKELMQWIESSNGAKGATVRIMQIMRSRPEVIEYETTMGLSNVSADLREVSAGLTYDNLLARPSVSLAYRPDTHPGVF